MLITSEGYVTGEAKDIKQLNRLMVYVRKDELRAGLFSYVNDVEENGDADAVDDFGAVKINHECLTTRIELPLTFAFDSLTAHFIKVIAGVDNGRSAHAA